MLLEAETAGAGASGRNGGFADASLTHGLLNGASRFPAELEALETLGRENLVGLRADLDRHGIDAAWQEPGMLSVATQPHELAELGDEAALLRRYGWDAEVLDRDAVRSLVNSPTYLGAVLQRTGAALVDPGALALGLRRTARRARRAAARAHAGREGGSRGADHAARTGAGAADPARLRRLSPARPPDPPAGGAGLRLRARHRAAR